MKNNLHILSVGTDRKLFEDGSFVSKRIADHGSMVTEIHIVVFAKKSLGFKEKKISNNVWIYPTNSFSKFLYVSDAIRIGRKIMKDRFFGKPSLITAQDPFECGFTALKIRGNSFVPVEIQMHIDPTFADGYDSFFDRIRKIIARKTLRSADTLRVVGGFISERIHKTFSVPTSKISVLPVYIDKDSIKNAQVDFNVHEKYGWDNVILSVARLTPQKDLETALKTLVKVREKYPNTGLVITGTGKDEDFLKKYAKDLGLEKQVAFAGWQRNLASFYKTSDVFLQTSIFEGYGMALVEAGLSDLPVVTTPVGVALELENGQDALICSFGDVGAFSESISLILEDKTKRILLKERLRNTLENKLPDKQIYLERLVKNWENVLSSFNRAT